MTYYVGGAGLSNGGGVSPYTGTQAYVPGANSCVIAYVSYYNGSQTLLSVSLTDNGTPNNNANWVQIGAQIPNNAGNGGLTSAWVVPKWTAGTGQTSISATITGGGGANGAFQLIVVEYGGVNASTQLPGNSIIASAFSTPTDLHTPGTTPGAVASPSFSTSQGNVLMIGCSYDGSSGLTQSTAGVTWDEFHLISVTNIGTSYITGCRYFASAPGLQVAAFTDATNGGAHDYSVLGMFMGASGTTIAWVV